MKKKRRIILICIIVLAAIWFWVWYFYGVDEPCLNCAKLWDEVKSVKVIEYEKCLEEYEECLELQRQWYNIACFGCDYLLIR